MRLQHFLISGILTASAFAAEFPNLIADGQFADWPEGKPAGWAARSPQNYEKGTGPEGAASLKVPALHKRDRG